MRIGEPELQEYDGHKIIRIAAMVLAGRALTLGVSGWSGRVDATGTAMS
ncbi:hypothetical protein [Microlunatus soli]|nr:hypothetical protein [Microlunatus soli]